MKAIFGEHVAPLMAVRRLETVTIDTEIIGLPEAALAPTLADLAKRYPLLYVKSHPGGFEGVSRVVVQLTGRGDEGTAKAEEACGELEAALTRMGAEHRKLARQDTQ
jgi:molybdopterin-biosynthesis enzyme MoeA-like protein